eukprot:g18523.t1
MPSNSSLALLLAARLAAGAERPPSLRSTNREPVGSGKILDPAAPLVLRCVDRWVSEIASHFSEADAATELPMPIHMPSDRYLDGLDEETRAAVIKRYIPEEPFGGTGVISNATDCFELMKKWEEVFSGPEFQTGTQPYWRSFPKNLGTNE